jgi:hypothetical protein
MRATLAEWQTTTKYLEDLIVQASSMDCDDGWRPWPIGMSWQYVLNVHKGPTLQLGSHTQTVLCAISTTTDERRRPSPPNRKSILDTLTKNGIQNHSVHHGQYFDTLPTYKFVISPEGNGIDCHRHYEALLAGCIPIVEDHPGIREKYKGCPILYTKDYSEITLQYLEQIYPTMLNTVYDFSPLLLSSYDKYTQSKIKESGNFWLNRIDATQCLWYHD